MVEFLGSQRRTNVAFDAAFVNALAARGPRNRFTIIWLPALPTAENGKAQIFSIGYRKKPLETGFVPGRWRLSPCYIILNR